MIFDTTLKSNINIQPTKNKLHFEDGSADYYSKCETIKQTQFLLMEVLTKSPVTGHLIDDHISEIYPTFIFIVWITILPNLCGGGRSFFVSDISMMCEMPNHENMIRHHDILNLIKHIPSIVGRLCMKKYHVGFTINYHIDIAVKYGLKFILW